MVILMPRKTTRNAQGGGSIRQRPEGGGKPATPRVEILAQVSRFKNLFMAKHRPKFVKSWHKLPLLLTRAYIQNHLS